jgi:hypothetical protein
VLSRQAAIGAGAAKAVLTIAADLADPVSPLPASADLNEVLCRIGAANGMPLPIVETGSSRSIGTTDAAPIVQAATLR